MKCELGHTQRSYECPACAEANGSNPQPIAVWEWYRTRTSSKRIKDLITARLDAWEAAQ